MTHPDPERNKAQAEFLAHCAPEDRRFHELMFMVGNATYRYHLAAKDLDPSEADWKEWIDGLNEPFKSGMIKEGFEKGKGILAFTRYVMEKHDFGLSDYLKENIDAKDLEEFNQLTK